MGSQGVDRYGSDVLADGGRRNRRIVPEVAGELGLVVETADGLWCGEVTQWQRTASGWAVVLEDRFGRERLFPPEPAGFLLDGKPVTLTRPLGARAAKPARTASGAFAADKQQRARVARAARIWVEGRHDAELIERIWGSDLREVGVVVEELGGIDELQQAIGDFGPNPHRRLVVLVDHLVPGSKESRIAAQVHHRWAPFVTVLGHPYVDVWQAVRPQALGIKAWPVVPVGTDWKEGVCRGLGWPVDTRAAWQRILARVRDYTDLEPALLARVEQAIDLVTAPPEQ